MVITGWKGLAKRLKASERRAAILAVARVLFADKGYHGVSVAQIARRLGVSPAYSTATLLPRKRCMKLHCTQWLTSAKVTWPR